MTDLSNISWDAWQALLIKSYVSPDAPEITRLGLPSFPSDEVQINTTGCAGPQTLRTSFLFAKSVCNAIQADLEQQFHKNPKRRWWLLKDSAEGFRERFFKKARLLDFGVGWGRITRSFLKEFKANRIVGLDVNPWLIDVCNSTFKQVGKFSRCDQLPPSLIGSASIDLVVSYSVFSHLSEKAFNAWLNEFERIVRPGGYVAITTRDRNFLDHCDSLKGQSVEAYPKILSELFDSFEEQRQAYDAVKFVISSRGYPANSELDNALYGEAWISPKYLENTIKGKFELVKHCTFEPEWVEPNMQPIYLLRRI